jgi:putative spermidine/putrescine transport system permease protein
MTSVAKNMTVAELQAISAKPRIQGRSQWKVVALLFPASLLIGLLLICSLAVLRISFGERHAEWSEWSLGSYRALLDGYYLRILADTIWLALVSAVATTILALPIALFMTRTASQAARRLVLICILLPMLVSVLVQSFGWMAILGPSGFLSQAVSFLTHSDQPVSFLFNRTGILLGLIQTAAPLAVLPIVASLRTIPIQLEEAAAVLGASRWRVYRHIILPLAWPGIVSGAILVFGFNTGAFVVPLLLGGMKVTTIAVVVRDQMGAILNWPMGATLSLMLILVALGVQAMHRLIAPGRTQRRSA